MFSTSRTVILGVIGGLGAVAVAVGARRAWRAVVEVGVRLEALEDRIDGEYWRGYGDALADSNKPGAEGTVTHLSARRPAPSM